MKDADIRKSLEGSDISVSDEPPTDAELAARIRRLADRVERGEVPVLIFYPNDTDEMSINIRDESCPNPAGRSAVVIAAAFLEVALDGLRRVLRGRGSK
jgi:hypothetical protein